MPSTIAIDGTVVTGDGLVGQVTYVAPNAAQVTLLSDETSAVSAVDLKTDAAGIVPESLAAALTIRGELLCNRAEECFGNDRRRQHHQALAA